MSFLRAWYADVKAHPVTNGCSFGAGFVLALILG